MRAPPDDESKILDVVKEGMSLGLEPDQQDDDHGDVSGVDSKDDESRFELTHQVSVSANPHLRTRHRPNHVLCPIISALSHQH